MIGEGELHPREACSSIKQAEGVCKSKGQRYKIYGDGESIVEDFTDEGCDEIL